MKVLLVHGVGHSEANPNYYEPWKTAIAANLKARGCEEPIEFDGLLYDDLFLQHNDSPGVYALAIAELLGSAAVHSIVDPIENLFRPSRDFGDDVRWKAGMVAQLCVESSLRTALRGLLADKLRSFQPDLIAAHSLGSLIAFDFFCNDARASKAANNTTYLTFGSQINNVFVHSRLFPGPIKVPAVRFWYHLYNEHDPVFTAPIKITDNRFLQVLTPSAAGHDPIGTPDAPGYLNHPETLSKVWTALASPKGARIFRRTDNVIRVTQAKPRRRAVLVGINEYPDPANRLEGCVNDTFLISAALQERGFDAEDIRVVLNERATAQGIRDRLAWLLDGSEDGMERVFFYSGHGAQMPGYNAAEKVDHVDECLVPWDFAWTKKTAIVDDDFFALYSNLPFPARFFAIFDCCHAGGIHRDGGLRARGITPPDDIRHRMLKWDAEQRMWLQRDFQPINRDFGGHDHEKSAYMGKNRATYRIGRGMKGRVLSQSVYRRLPPDERGPYLPVIIEACQEGDLSYEYRDGTASYGAFTYSMVKNLRVNPGLSFVRLVSHTAQTLKALNYAQEPQILGPDSVVNKPIPGAPTAAGRKARPMARASAVRKKARRAHGVRRRG